MASGQAADGEPRRTSTSGNACGDAISVVIADDQRLESGFVAPDDPASRS